MAGGCCGRRATGMLARVWRRAGRGGRWRRWAWRIAGLALLGSAVALPLLLRAAWEGRAERAAAAAAGEDGRVDLEIVHLGRAARWRVPVAGHDEAALARLMALADGEVAPQTALMALREARAALRATWAWRANDEAAYEAVNRKIAALMAAQERVFGTDLSGRGDAEGYHRGLLAAARPGRAAWAPMLGAALVVAAIGLGVGAPQEGGVKWRVLGVAGALALMLAVSAWWLSAG